MTFLSKLFSRKDVKKYLLLYIGVVILSSFSMFVLIYFIEYKFSLFSFAGSWSPVIILGFFGYYLEDYFLASQRKKIVSSFKKLKQNEFLQLLFQVMGVVMITAVMGTCLLLIPNLFKTVEIKNSVYDIKPTTNTDNADLVYDVENYQVLYSDALIRYLKTETFEDNQKITEIVIGAYIPVADTVNHKLDPSNHKYWLYHPVEFKNKENRYTQVNGTRDVYQTFVDSLVSATSFAIEHEDLHSNKFLEPIQPDGNMLEIVKNKRSGLVMFKAVNSNVSIDKVISAGAILFALLLVIIIQCIFVAYLIKPNHKRSNNFKL